MIDPTLPSATGLIAAMRTDAAVALLSGAAGMSTGVALGPAAAATLTDPAFAVSAGFVLASGGLADVTAAAVFLLGSADAFDAELTGAEAPVEAAPFGASMDLAGTATFADAVGFAALAGGRDGRRPLCPVGASGRWEDLPSSRLRVRASSAAEDLVR